MRLDKYINDLLFLHDCVIITDFGGFVAHYRPSYLHKDYHTISPPAKVIAFNKELRENDGLLANYLCKQLNINYKSACDEIAEFASLATNELESGKIFKIEHIGQFEYDKEKNLQFKADPESNYLISSFGLSVVHSPVIKRDELPVEARPKPPTKKKPKKKKTLAVNSKKEKRKKNPVFALLEVVPVAALMLLLLLKPGIVDNLNEKLATIIPLTNNFDANWTNNTADNSEYQSEVERNLGSVFITDSNTASLDDANTANEVEDLWEESDSDLADESEVDNSADESSLENIDDSTSDELENEEELARIKSEEDAKLKDEADAKLKAEEEVRLKDEADARLKAEEAKNNSYSQSNSDSKFYIIGGCFGVQSNADNYLSKLQSEGFPASIAGVNSRGLHMVAFDGAATLSEATKKLESVRAKSYSSAWIYKP